MSMLPSGLPAHVADDETLARFITSSSHMNSMGVKPVAFLPNPQNGETSVFRHGKTPEDQLWAIGQAVVAGSGRNIHGAAFVLTGDVRNETPSVVASEPPERHANIGNWPSEADLALQKAHQVKIAMRLAEKSDLIRSP